MSGALSAYRAILRTDQNLKDLAARLPEDHGINETNVEQFIKVWSERRGHSIRKEADSSIYSFSYVMSLSNGVNVHVMTPAARRGYITFAAKLVFSPSDSEKYTEMDPLQQRKFINTLNIEMARKDVSFTLRPPAFVQLEENLLIRSTLSEYDYLTALGHVESATILLDAVIQREIAFQ